MEPKVNILGRDLALRFNMEAQIIFEQITGQPFNPTKFIEARTRMAVCYACILSGCEKNEASALPEFDDILKFADGEEISRLTIEVSRLIAKWYHIPDVEAEAKSVGEAAGQGEDKGNA